MKTLIPMTDFVLQILNQDPPYNEVKMLIEISNYANFLKRPLELGMFVPVDEKAKEKVLFKGWEVKETKNSKRIKYICREFDLINTYPLETLSNYTVENLLTGNREIELTQTAINQIFE